MLHMMKYAYFIQVGPSRYNSQKVFLNWVKCFMIIPFTFNEHKRYPIREVCKSLLHIYRWKRTVWKWWYIGKTLKFKSTKLSSLRSRLTFIVYFKVFQKQHPRSYDPNFISPVPFKRSWFLNKLRQWFENKQYCRSMIFTYLCFSKLCWNGDKR